MSEKDEKTVHSNQDGDMRPKAEAKKATPTAKKQPETTDDKKSKKFPWKLIFGGLALAALVFGVSWFLRNQEEDKSDDQVVKLIQKIELLEKQAQSKDNFEKPAAPVVIEPVVVKKTITWEQVPPVIKTFEPRGAEVQKVDHWIQLNGFWIPLRKMPNGRFAGYGDTYSNPPEGGGALPADTAVAASIKSKKAQWTRNEGGDWAIAQK